MKLGTSLGLFALLLVQTEALRFAHFPVTVDTDILIVGRRAELTCNYVKFRTETVREITWFVGYNGMRMQIFKYDVGNSEVEGSSYDFVETYEDSATENGLTITLPEFREPWMTVGCEVQVLRDSGYGSVRHSKKLGESNITVANTRNHQMVLRPGPPSASMREMGGNRLVTVGRPLTVTCVSRGSMPSPNLTLTINGKNIDEMSGGRIDVVPFKEAASGEHVVTGYLDAVSSEEFEDVGVLVVECVAKFNDFLLEKKQLALKKNNEMRAVYRGPREWVDMRKSNRQFDETMRGESLIKPRLLDMIDPSRHIHPGIPYDFYSGYIVLVAERLTTDRPAFSHVLGELPPKVQRALEQQFAYFQQVSRHNVKMKMPPVDVLNLLGGLGYRVIGTSSPQQKEMVWTLEHRNYEDLITRNEI